MAFQSVNRKSTIGRINPILRVALGAMGALSRVAPGYVAGWYADRFLTTTRHPVPLRETEWALGAERVSVRSGDRELPGWSWGEGPTILLTHGWSGRGLQLGAFAAPLAAQGYRVITFDAPGHGSSPGKRSSVVEFAEAIEAYAGEFGNPAAVIAHSLGTAAVSLALRRGLRTHRLVYIAAPEDAGVYIHRIADRFGLPATVADGAMELIERRFGISWSDFDSRRVAGAAALPLLLVHDRDDHEVEIDQARNLREAWSGARLHETEGLGHRRILRDPAVVAAVTSFLGAAPNAAPTGLENESVIEPSPESVDKRDDLLHPA